MYFRTSTFRAILAGALLFAGHQTQASDCSIERYFNGKVHLQSAIAACRAEAASGDAEAQFNLGQFYYEGVGVPQDDAMAAQNYERAVNQGHSEAALYLGYLYEHGRGVRKDPTRERELMEMAARGGEVGGIDALADMAFWREDDLIKATFLYHLVVLHGDQAAQRRVTYGKEKLTDEQFSIVQNAAQICFDRGAFDCDDLLAEAMSKTGPVAVNF